jgi:hypothetical protein
MLRIQNRILKLRKLIKLSDDHSKTLVQRNYSNEVPLDYTGKLR